MEQRKNSSGRSIFSFGSFDGSVYKSYDFRNDNKFCVEVVVSNLYFLFGDVRESGREI